MNSINLLGRLTRDVEVRYSQSANPVAIANFGLAVNRRFKKQGEQEADFMNCTAFGKTAELIQQYVAKGEQLGITGRLAIDQYQKDGENRTATKIMVEAITFVSSPKGDSGGFAPVGAAARPQGQFADMHEDEEDLPF